MTKKIIKIVAGIFIVLTAICGYFDPIGYLYELTFISNFTAGIVLLSDGVLGLTLDKNVPALIYQLVLPCIIAVFSTCAFALLGLFSFNFEGAFFFLHIINPPVFLLIYLFCVESRIESRSDFFKNILISPLMVTCYLIFDLARFFITGYLVYGLIPTEMINAVSAVFIVIGFYLLMAFMSFGLIRLKLFVQKKINRAPVYAGN